MLIPLSRLVLIAGLAPLHAPAPLRPVPAAMTTTPRLPPLPRLTLCSPQGRRMVC